MTTIWIIVASWIWLHVGYLAGVLDSCKPVDSRLRTHLEANRGVSRPRARPVPGNRLEEIQHK